MEAQLRHFFNKPFTVKQPEDIILNGVPLSVIETCYRYKLLQQRIGQAWELTASFCGWEKGENGIDLINRTTKQVAEIKNNARTDNSASRRRNMEKLVEFKQTHPDYELLYICINDNTDKNVMKFNNRVRYVSGNHALHVLFGRRKLRIIAMLRRLVLEFLNNTGLSTTNCE